LGHGREKVPPFGGYGILKHLVYPVWI